jgi:internalin A
MKKVFFALATAFVFILAGCQKEAVNEQLPEYCRTYSGFTDTASKDLFELLAESGHSINRYNYQTVISEIELSFEQDDPNYDIDLSGLQCFQNLTSLSLIGRSFKDISPIRALHNIQSLELRNTSVVSIDSFKGLSKINNLVINGTKTLQNVEGVSEMTKLTTLDLSGNGLVNIGELNSLVNLQHLYVNDNEIMRFPSINNLVHLETLDISDNQINELGEDLSGLSSLMHLNASHNKICDISALGNLESLEILDLSFNDLGCLGDGVSPNFDSLENAQNLRVLKLNDNNLTSIEGLRDRNISLEVLDLQNNQIQDLTPIAQYTNIQELYLSNNNITNIDNLSGMTGLTEIDLSSNLITDFSNLLTIPNLTNINLSNNQITSIPDISASWSNLSVLDLHSNLLQDVSGVEGHSSIESLILYNNGLTKLHGLSNLPELDELVIQSELENQIPPEDQRPNIISVIEDSFNNVPRLSLSTDHVLDLGFQLGDNVQIFNSFNDISTIALVDLSNQDIDFIDEFSFNLPNLAILNLSGNNISDLSFVLGNPSLVYLDISDNPVTDLSYLADSEDLSQLQVLQSTNTNVTNLTDTLRNLSSLEEVYLTGNPLQSIDNSLVNLPFLNTLLFDTNQISEITGSFHSLNRLDSSRSNLYWNGGVLEKITDSFYDCTFSSLIIENQTPTNPVTAIENSFHNITLETPNAVIKINNSDFKTIVNSFYQISGDSVEISNAHVATISGSFQESQLNSLDLSENILTDLPGLNQINYVRELNLNDNQLTSVSFIDGINGLEVLSFELQRDSLNQPTLTSIDGINHIPLLTTLNMDTAGIQSIDGFIETGLTNLDLSKTALAGGTLTSISAQSFAQSPITYLDLSGHALNDVDFLQNLSFVQILSIGLDVVDLTFMQGLPMESTLTSLSINNTVSISDFQALSNYDVLNVLNLPDNITTIQNLDGLDQLQEVRLDESVITSITDSFNNLPVFSFSPSYLDAFTSLSIVTRSFDLVGINEGTGQVDISSEVTIVDSFHNASNLRLLSSVALTELPFDTDSFTAINSLYIQNADLTNYAILSAYSSLHSVTIDTLYGDISDLSNKAVTSLDIRFTTGAVTQLNATLAVDATLSFSTIKVGSLGLDTNASELSLDTPNLAILLNSSATNLNLSGNTNGLTIIADELELLQLGDLTATTMTTQTPLLTSITKQTGSIISLTSVEVNSQASTLQVELDATSLTLYDDSLTQLNLNNSGNTTLYHNQISLSGTINTANFEVYNDLLESIDFTSGNTASMTVDASTIQNITGSITISQLDLLANVTSISITLPNLQTGQLQTPNLNTMEVNSPDAQMTILTNETAFSVTNTSSISSLDLSGSTAINQVNIGSAEINSVSIAPLSSAVTLQASSSVTFDITSTSLSNLNVDASLADVNLHGSASTLGVIATATNLTVDSISLQEINFDDVSTLQNVTLIGGSNFNLVAINAASITSLNVTTDAVLLDLSSINVNATNVIGDVLSVMTVDVGLHDFNLASNSSSLSLTAIANDVTLQLSASSVTLGDATNVSNLTISSDSLTSVSMSNASIAHASISGGTGSLNVSGSAIGVLEISSAVASINAITGLGTDLLVVSSSSDAFTVNTTSSTLDLSGSADATISSGTLEQVNLQIVGHSVTIDVDKPSLSFSLSGEASDVSITGDDFVGLSIQAESSFDSLNVISSNLSLLDLTNVNVNALSLHTTSNSFSIIAPIVQTITLIGDALSTISMDASSSNLTINSSASSMSLSGDAQALTLQNNNISSLDASVVNAASFTVIADSLTSLVVPSSSASTLDVQTLAASFDLTSDVGIIQMSVDGNYATLHVPTSSNISLSTDASNLTLDALNGNIVINSPQLRSIAGQASSTTINGITQNALNVDFIGTLSLSYEGLNPYAVTFLSADQVTLDLGSITSLTLTGQVTDLTVIGSNLNAFGTDSLQVTQNLIINDTTLTTLDFASTNLLTSLDSLTINTLSVDQVESVLSQLSGYTLTLYSPITLSDIETYYYDTRYAELLVQEDIDNVRYDSFYQVAVDESVSRMLANTYLNHFGETELRNQVETDSLLSQDDYFTQYLASVGLTVDDLAPGEETTIRDAIQTTIDEVNALVDPTNLQNQVIASIEEDATTYATDQLSSLTFTIG